jgi:hypothetical protein
MRTLFWRTGDPFSANQQACATWTQASQLFTQHGVAVRISKEADRTTGITVTKGVYAYDFTVFNVHLWDNSQPDAGLRFLAQFQLQPTVQHDGGYLPLPWRMCVRVIGDILDFMVWPTMWRGQPAWGEPGVGGAVQLPPDAPQAGRPGWYMGHLLPGQWARYGSLLAEALP